MSAEDGKFVCVCETWVYEIAYFLLGRMYRDV